MRFVTSIAILSTITAVASAASVTITNDCAYQVDPAFYPAATLPDNSLSGGFAIESGDAADVALEVVNGWRNGGSIWGRTGCDTNGNCATGGCGAENCTSPAPSGVTEAKFELEGPDDTDAFGPSTVNGFNIPITIVTGAGCTGGNSTTSQECTGQDTGYGCNTVVSCSDGTDYYVIFC